MSDIARHGDPGNHISDQTDTGRKDKKGQKDDAHERNIQFKVLSKTRTDPCDFLTCRNPMKLTFRVVDICGECGNGTHRFATLCTEPGALAKASTTLSTKERGGGHTVRIRGPNSSRILHEVDWFR